MITPEQAALLRKPFERQQIGKLPKGGVMLDYVGHAATTDRLLQADPSWSWEPFAVDDQGLPAMDAGRNLWIRLTVCGVTRIGVGDGKSAKECIGDAIRNAAMRFGVALDLWAKEDLAATIEHVEVNPLAVAKAAAWEAWQAYSGNTNVEDLKAHYETITGQHFTGATAGCLTSYAEHVMQEIAK